MYHFQNDYSEGAHPQVWARLDQTNSESTSGYGTDAYCEAAREKIKRACEAPEADVHFLVGGTQTNLTVISALLRPHQGVLSAEEGHICVHETGAIEATGHKVLPLPSEDGTITAQQVKEYCEAHYASGNAEHTVQPGMVYISYPTELGTLYSKEELEALHRVCREYELPLFVDGARMAFGLGSPEADLTLADFARLTDVFYIGGTKCGALFGEAVVIVNEALKKDFRYLMKQRGGLLAKGRLLGVQFDALFTDDLYTRIGADANRFALTIRNAFEKTGVRFYADSSTNQQLVLLNEAQRAHFSDSFVFDEWGLTHEGEHILRFCTSWATTEESVTALCARIRTMPTDAV